MSHPFFLPSEVLAFTPDGRMDFGLMPLQEETRSAVGDRAGQRLLLHGTCCQAVC